MSQIRLLPVLVFGMVSLLSLKLLSMFMHAPSQAEYAAKMANANVIARSITMLREGVQDDQVVTGSTGKKDDKKDEKSGKPAAPEMSPDELAKAKAETKAKMEPEGTRIVPPNTPQAAAGPSAEERVLLEKLKDRRTELEARDRELEMRDNLIRMSERKLDDRIGELRSLEGQAGASGKNDPKSRYKPLVVMYESMKPKEAARVFDRLDVKILLELVDHMNPRKMSEILAAMDPAAAEKLTVAMARKAASGEGQLVDATPTETELPRLPLPGAAPAGQTRR